MRKLLPLLLLFLWLPLQASDTRVAVSASPRVGQVGHPVRVRITIEPDTENRAACFVWDSGIDGGRSCWSLDGERAARTTYKDLVHLVQGEYTLQVFVSQSNEKVLSSIPLTVRVTGGIPE